VKNSTGGSADQQPDALSITDLTEQIKNTLESGFRNMWVIGEISNLTKHSSGHWYFTLKDDKAQIQAVMFRFANAKVKFTPEAGQKVLAFGDVSVYPPRGNYQIKLTKMQPEGIGELQLAFEQLKKKLEQEGLFGTEHKKPMPYLPRRVGVVTSPTGAAIRDIINVLTRRYPNIEVILCPVRVQGDIAAKEIVAAIERLNELVGLDVLIVGRGGGSIEDLWAFNEEIVARAIFASELPIISAVGHEVDFTIADFVADLRAPTPSAAAELAVPEKQALIEEIRNLRKRLASGLTTRLERVKEAFTSGALRRLYRKPLELVELSSQRLDDTTTRMVRSLRHDQELRTQKLCALLDKIQVLNPVDTLKRGFAIASIKGTKQVVRYVDDVNSGDELDLKVNDGRIRCTVVGKTREHLDGQGKIF